MELAMRGTAYLRIDFIQELCRWGENGPIACSFDGKRLFSSYRNGGIAVILDTNGDGSIMNPRGNCVVTIRENDGDLVADILSEEDGRLVSRYLKSDPKETERHRWNFQGLMIFFFPDSWEVHPSNSLVIISSFALFRLSSS
jgi:hypothetical protein